MVGVPCLRTPNVHAATFTGFGAAAGLDLNTVGAGDGETVGLRGVTAATFTGLTGLAVVFGREENTVGAGEGEGLLPAETRLGVPNKVMPWRLGFRGAAAAGLADWAEAVRGLAVLAVGRDAPETTVGLSPQTTWRLRWTRGTHVTTPP